jgi:hypothetical protein
MLYPLWSSSIHLKAICLGVFLVVAFSRFAFPLRVDMVLVVCAVHRDVDVMLSVLLCLLHWLVGFPTLLD